MKDYERVRQLRKRLKMSQTAFAERLGLTRSVIKNIELGTVEIKEHVIRLITTTFNVSEQWIRTGEGEMFVKSKQTILDELVAAHGLNNKETIIIKAFLDLSPEGRAGVLEYVDKLVEINSQSQTDDLASGSTITIDKPVQMVFPIAGRNGESGKVILSEEEAEAAQEFIHNNYPELE